jgi:hypothetical protein
MRYILIAGVLLAAMGCRNVDGPFQANTMRVDDPCYTIGEQRRLARAKLSLPEDSTWVLPPGQTRPGAWGTQVN